MRIFAIAALVTARPGAASTIVEHFGDRAIDERTADALEAIASDAHEWVFREDRAQAASALDELRPDEGVAYSLDAAKLVTAGLD